jgi:hypothetical protein
MKKRTFIIRSENEISRLSTFLKSQPKEPVLEVIVQDHKKDRTAQQNSLYRLWNSIISDELGWSKEEVEENFKRRFLVPIYERDDIGYAEMIQSVRRVYSQGLKDDANAMFEHIVKLTSTANAKVKQFMEYLKDIERDMADKGIILPHPEDRYIDAVGGKKNV